MEILDEYADYDLKTLVRAFLEIKNFNKVEDVQIVGKSGQEYQLDFLLSRQDQVDGDYFRPQVGETGIIVKDYGKSAGADVITKAEKIGVDCGFDKITVVSNFFGGIARSLANRTGKVITITRGELVSILRTYGVTLDA